MRTPRTVVNRLLLAVTGLTLLFLGLAVLTGSLDLARRWELSLPSWWPYQGPDDVLLTEEDRMSYRDRAGDRWWPVVLGGLGAVVLAALWWLLAQVRTGRARRIRLGAGDGEGTVLRAGALEEVLAAEAATVAGVADARARVTGGRGGLTGRRGGPRLRLSVVLAPHAAPVTVLARLDAEVLDRARRSLGAERFPAEARLRSVRHRAGRVS